MKLTVETEEYDGVHRTISVEDTAILLDAQLTQVIDLFRRLLFAMSYGNEYIEEYLGTPEDF